MWRSSNVRSWNRYEWEIHLYGNWLEPGRTELTNWSDLLCCKFWLSHDRFNAYPPSRIGGSLNSIRHKTVHRSTPRIVDILEVMKLPSILGDESRNDKIKYVYETVFESSGQNLSKERVEGVDIILYEPKIPGTSVDLLTRIEYLLEDSIFVYCQNRRVTWEPSLTPESIEIQEFQDGEPFDCDTISQQQELFPNSNSGLFKRTLGEMRRLRNAATHRHSNTDSEIMLFVKEAILCACLLDDRLRALEIEILAEAWLTSRSRWEVLDRLRQVSFDDLTLRLIWKQRMARARPSGSESVVLPSPNICCKKSSRTQSRLQDTFLDNTGRRN